MIKQDIQDCLPVQRLVDLGLTPMQATVYSTLVKLGKAEVQKIANASSVARSEIYRVMPNLLKLGLAEKILDATTMYEATPIEDGIAILLNNKKGEYEALKNEADEFLRSFNFYNPRDLESESSQFRITSERTVLRKMLRNLIQSSQESIDIATPWNVTVHKLNNWEYESHLRIRLVTEKNPSIQKMQTLAKKFNMEFRCSSQASPFGIHIFDEREVAICLNHKEGVPSLWSNNSNVVELAIAYFENLWNSSE